MIFRDNLNLMSKENRVIAFGSSAEATSEESNVQASASHDAILELGESEEASDWISDEFDVDLPRRSRLGWIVPAIAFLAVFGWSGFFAWSRQSEIVSVTAPAQWAQLTSDWAVPVLLVCVLWLLFMRSSSREASRFGDAARLLANESANLEARLTTVNRELSLAREFISSQSRDLETLGRLASERLSENAERLQALIRENGSRVDNIGKVSETALENMEKLRGQLPVIASSAKDVTNNIGTAGRTAKTQLDDMITGFKRINEFGTACEAQVNKLCQHIEASIAGFTLHCSKMEDAAKTRFDEIEEHGSNLRTQLELQEVEALASIRSRATALSEELAQTRTQLDSDEEACIASMRVRLNTIRDEGGTIARSLRDGEERAMEGWRSALSQLGEDKDKALDLIGETAHVAIETAERRFAAIAAELASFEAEITQRTAALDQEIDARRAKASQIETEALSRIGKISENLETQLTERSQRLSDEIEQRGAKATSAHEQTLKNFDEMFAQFEVKASEYANKHEHESAAIAERTEGVLARLEQYVERMNTISAQADEAEAQMSTSLKAIALNLEETQTALTSTGKDIAKLTDSSVRLLELLQASSNQTRSDLPKSIEASENQLSALEERIGAMRGLLEQAGGNTSRLVRQVETANVGLKAAMAEIDRLQASVEDHDEAQKEVLASIQQSLSNIEIQSNKLSQKARTELSEAIERLSTSARDAISSISDQSAGSIHEIAEKLGDESAAAIEKAMHAKAEEAAGQLEAAALHAAGIGKEAATQLRDQLAKINELVGNLERRVTQARERAEENVDNDFARRAALITESLKSNAIDIAKALSSDVTDTAWAAYLRGDRGIFTRRAVTLIDNSEAKAILQVFERDPDFHEHVSRYIHDFEAILRQVLSTRDGNALGVTLLSSDMGKLYVALAQAIERLRN